MKIKIETLAPVHIGSGEEISPSEYYIDKDSGRFVRLNMDALLLDPSFNRYRDKFIKEAAMQRYIGSILDAPLLKKYPLYSVPISQGAKSYIATNQTVVKGFVKTAGRVFIPGSSLKGSILSAMVYHFLKESYINNSVIERKYFDEKSKKQKIEKISSQVYIESMLSNLKYDKYDNFLNYAFSHFSLLGKANRFYQWINIADSNHKESKDSLEISLAKVKGARQGGELPVLYETIKAGQSFEIEITQVKSKLSEKEILGIAHNYYLKVLDHDKVDIDRSPYLLRVGQGSTAYSTSLLILAEELGIKTYRVHNPRTRKRIDDIMAMGWIKVTI